jgi:microcystin-dependent protein
MPAINRYYSSVAVDTTLKFGITSTDLTFEVDSTAGFPTSYPYTIAIGFDSSSEELVTIVAASGTILTVGSTVAGGGNISGRGVDGTSDQSHDAGEIVKHVISARDMTESQAHIAAESGAHGIAGNFVGTTDTQALTNKTISSANNTMTIAQSAVTNLTTDLGLKAPLAGPTFTGTVTLPTGVTGATGAITSNMLADGTIVNADINASAAIDWTKLAVSSTVSATELGYLDGVTSAIQTQINSIVTTPTGVLNQWAGAAVSPPTGWLLCDGAPVSRSTYSTLFGIVGTTYGSGDGSTTFNLPNLKGKVPVGLDSSQTEFDTLGETGGVKEVTLTTAQIPDHTHGGQIVFGTGSGGTANVVASGNNPLSQPTTGGVTGTSGGAHTNLQPYIVVNYIIKH